MPLSPAVVSGLAIAVVLVVLSVGFALRQWLDRRRREPELSEPDARYFARQDARRLFGSTLMLLIAAGMSAGVLLNPRADRQTGQLWGLIWLGVSVLVILLLLLGVADWLAVRSYAVRHRRALDAERRCVLAAERQRLLDEDRARRDSGNGRPPSA